MMITLLFWTLTGLLGLAFLALAAEVTGVWLTLADRAREIAKTALLDAVQVWNSQQQARLDIAARDSDLDHNRDLAQLKIQQHRLKLLAGGD